MKNAKMTINVVFVREDSGNCRQIFKDMNSSNYYCRTEKETVWRSLTPAPDLEPDCPIHANFNICDSLGNIITDDVLYPFMCKFIKKEYKELIENNKTHELWREYLLQDKETYKYNGYNDTWLYYETNKTDEVKLGTLNYFGKEIEVVKESYEHKISKKRWTKFEARIGDITIVILGYKFEEEKYPKALCDFPTSEESEKCTNEKCFYFKNDRCIFLDSDTQIMLSGHDEDM